MNELIYILAKLFVAATLGFGLGWTFGEYTNRHDIANKAIVLAWLIALIIAILLEAFVL